MASTLATATGTASAAPAGTASPATIASPATVYNVSINNIQGQLDTNPGNGYASWIWGYNPSGTTAYVQYQFYGASGDTPSGSMYVSPYGGTQTANFTQSIWRIRIRYLAYVDNYGYAHWASSSWS
jgi:hypothetical protein